MKMIVLGEENGKIVLVSKKGEGDSAIMHIGSYLTVEEPTKENLVKKFILRVEESYQQNSFNISPMLVDMNLKPLTQDQKVKNLVKATRITESPERMDGFSSSIKPLMEARVSNQEEINLAIGSASGVKIFPATAFARSSQILKDENGTAISANIPDDAFFYQMLITGPTGSGKTVSMKYLAQYFVENFKDSNGKPGAVLAVNKKEEDFLYMDKPSKDYNKEIEQEWKDLKLTPKGLTSFHIYYPGKSIPNYSNKVDRNRCEGITLTTKKLDPNDISGLISNLTQLGSEQLPNIFRYWQDSGKNGDTMKDFINYFIDSGRTREFMIKTSNGSEYLFQMHPGTYNNIVNSLQRASVYFDVENAKEIDAEDILERRKMSVIDVSDKNMIEFGAVLLRNILDKIYEAKSKGNDVPVLLIIDEVHDFYSNNRSREALGTLDAIARKGRSLKIGVIFASQNPEDIPSGISKVVNSQINFKGIGSKLDIKSQYFDPEGLKSGYAVSKIFGLSQVKLIKFPMSPGGVYIDER